MIRAEYIESGAFQASLWQSRNAGFKPRDVAVVLTKAEYAALTTQIEAQREALHSIRETAHCIAKAGPLNTPTLQDAWGKFMCLSALATKGIADARVAGSVATKTQ